MKTKKGSTRMDIIITSAIIIIIILATIVTKQIYITTEPTPPQIVKVSTYTDREIYVDLKTLEPVKKGTYEIGDILRIEFPHITDANNNYIQLEGKHPIEFADRVETVKKLSILKGIVTEKDFESFKTPTRETVGGTTTIIYSK